MCEYASTHMVLLSFYRASRWVVPGGTTSPADVVLSPGPRRESNCDEPDNSFPWLRLRRGWRFLAIFAFLILFSDSLVYPRAAFSRSWTLTIWSAIPLAVGRHAVGTVN